MYFVFKLSFVLHRVTNQNFKKRTKFLITHMAKIEEKCLKGCVSEDKCNLGYQFFFFLSTLPEVDTESCERSRSKSLEKEKRLAERISTRPGRS